MSRPNPFAVAAPGSRQTMRLLNNILAGSTSRNRDRTSASNAPQGSSNRTQSQHRRGRSQSRRPDNAGSRQQNNANGQHESNASGQHQSNTNGRGHPRQSRSRTPAPRQAQPNRPSRGSSNNNRTSRDVRDRSQSASRPRSILRQPTPRPTVTAPPTLLSFTNGPSGAPPSGVRRCKFFERGLCNKGGECLATFFNIDHTNI